MGASFSKMVVGAATVFVVHETPARVAARKIGSDRINYANRRNTAMKTGIAERRALGKNAMRNISAADTLTREGTQMTREAKIAAVRAKKKEDLERRNTAMKNKSSRIGAGPVAGRVGTFLNKTREQLEMERRAGRKLKAQAASGPKRMLIAG